MTVDPAFRLRDVTFAYDGRVVLDLPGLDIRSGETLALVGPNGSGKTTLLKILNDLLRPSSGQVLFRGRPASGSAELRACSVYVHQSPFLLAGTVFHNVAFGLRIRHIPEREKRSRVEESLELLGLSGFGRRDAKRLSGGETQRVALARALALKPEILLLDEPTAQTDRESGERIRSVLTRLATERGVTIVLSSHDAPLAEALAERLVYMEEGRLVRIEDPKRRREPQEVPGAFKEKAP